MELEFRSQLIAHFIELKKSINNGLTLRLYYIFVSNKDCIIGHALQVTMLVCIECIYTNDLGTAFLIFILNHFSLCTWSLKLMAPNDPSPDNTFN